MARGRKKTNTPAGTYQPPPPQLQVGEDDESDNQSETSSDASKLIWQILTTVMTTGAMLHILIVGGEVLEIDESICLGTWGAMLPVVIYLNYSKYKILTKTSPTPPTRAAYAHLEENNTDGDDEPQTPPYHGARRPSRDPVFAVSPVVFNTPSTPSFIKPSSPLADVGTERKTASLARIVSAVPPICELNMVKDIQIESLTTQVNQLRSELESSKLEQERLSRQNERMLEQLETKSPPRQNTKLVLESKNSELASLRAENSNLKKESETNSEQISELKETITQKETELQSHADHLNTLEAVNDSSDEDSMIKRLHEATRRNLELKKSIEDLQGLVRAAQTGEAEGIECGELAGWKRREEEIRRAHLNLVIREGDVLSNVINKLNSKSISSLTLESLTSEESSVLAALFQAKSYQATTLLQSLTFATHCSDSLMVLMNEPAPFPMDADAAGSLKFVSEQLSQILKSASEVPKLFEMAVDAIPVTITSQYFAP